MPAPIITLGSVSLPGDLVWADEFAWNPVAQSSEYSLTGALIVQAAPRLAGRPITLEAKDSGAGYVWVVRSTVLALRTLAETPGWTGTLTLADARTFSVGFREEGVLADPVRFIAPLGESDAYTLTLKLQTV